jgi:hypothetical protein
MTTKAKVNKMTLQIGDYIAFDSAAQDLDTPDTTVWMRITEVVVEDGYRGYKVAFPDGEPMSNVIQARYVGRFKKALDFATDERDVSAMEKIWSELTLTTRTHEWNCFCNDCAVRNSIGQELVDIYQEQFEARKVRLSQYEVGVKV